jgi:hypothetical protein
VVYEIADWNFATISQVLKARIGEIFQYKTFKALKQELETDLQELMIKESEKRTRRKP